jgi:hypothetical protein
MSTPSKRLARKVVAQPRPDPVADKDDGDFDPDEPDTGNGQAPASKGSASRIRSGWTEGQKQAESTSTFANVFKPTSKTEVIKFLQDQPYASYRRHWLPFTTQDGRRSNRPYVCPLSFDDQCPLCEVGDRASAVFSFNIAVCGDDGQVLHRSWDAGVRVFNALKGYSQDPKIAPLTRNFFLVSKTGEGTSTQYNVAPVRASALQEDYDIPVPDQSEFDRLVLYTPEIVTVEPVKKLRELARELTADY